MNDKLVKLFREFIKIVSLRGRGHTYIVEDKRQVLVREGGGGKVSKVSSKLAAETNLE